MATLREVKGRIVGVKKTQKITKAMKMVAAAKLRRAQTGVVAARPYARKMKELLQHLTSHVPATDNPLLTTKPVERLALVVVTSDRGMCGAFNANLVKAAMNHVAANYPGVTKEHGLTLYCIGRKGFDFFSKRGYTVAGKYLGIGQHLAFGKAQAITADLVNDFLDGAYDRIDIIYNEFKNVAQQKIVAEQFLPVAPPPEDLPGATGGRSIDYIYEPSATGILESIVPRHLNFQIWRVLLESNASEEGARMTAMENATDNADEMISSLQLQYNKARQAAITKELLEIVAGAEALQKAG